MSSDKENATESTDKLTIAPAECDAVADDASGRRALRHEPTSSGPQPPALPPQKPVASQASITPAALMLAAACYTRGVWSLLFVARRLWHGPLRARATPWRLDESFVRLHLCRAALWAIPWTVAELMLLLMYWLVRDPVSGFMFVAVVLAQWLVFPWLMIRHLARGDVEFASNGHLPGEGFALVVTDENDGEINDLGFLIREANFGVDVEKSAAEPDDQSSKSDALPVIEEFYQRVENAFVKNEDVVAQRIVVRGSQQVQPGDADWPDWWRPASRPCVVQPPLAATRLLIQGQHREIDGLSTVELAARSVESHLAFHIRLRWLPAMKPRLQRLMFVARERAWWRAGVLPLLLALGLLLHAVVLASVSGKLQRSQQRLLRANLNYQLDEIARLAENGDPAAIAMQSRLDEMAQVLRVQGIPESEIRRLQVRSFEREIEDQLGTSEASAAGFAILPAVAIAAVVALLPVVLFALLALWRLVRYVRGCICVGARAYLNVAPIDGVRLAYAGTQIVEGDALRWSLSYLHTIEEVVLNRIIFVLQDHGIDTSSIRQEMTTFVNQGIYMTGGNLRAENLAVGSGSMIKIFARRRAKRGQGALMSRSESKS